MHAQKQVGGGFPAGTATHSLIIDIGFKIGRLDSEPADAAELRELRLAFADITDRREYADYDGTIDRRLPVAVERSLPFLSPPPSPDACSLIKLGGSLLTLPKLRERLDLNLDLLAEYPIVVVGGGGLADVVRQWDSVHELSVNDSDLLARMTLSISAEFVRRLIPTAAIAKSFDAAARILSGGWRPIVDMRSVFEDPIVELPPQGWHVTSDSMAAIIARVWGLRELILVKSAPCPARNSIEQAAAEGLVDAYFPAAVRGGLKIQWCDGRGEIWQAEHWLSVDRA